METITTIPEGYNKEVTFEVYPNDEIINIGDYFTFYFAGKVCVGHCDSESEHFEINPNNKPYNNEMAIDLVHGFWKKCNKIKTCSIDLKVFDL